MMAMSGATHALFLGLPGLSGPSDDSGSGLNRRGTTEMGSEVC